MATPYCTISTPELHAQLQQALEDFRLIQQRHARYRALVHELAATRVELALLSLRAAQELQTIRRHWAYALIEPDLYPALDAQGRLKTTTKRKTYAPPRFPESRSPTAGGFCFWCASQPPPRYLPGAAPTRYRPMIHCATQGVVMHARKSLKHLKGIALGPPGPSNDCMAVSLGSYSASNFTGAASGQSICIDLLDRSARICAHFRAGARTGVF